MPNTAARNETLAEAVQLDLDAHHARQAGKFDAAVSFASLSDAVRSGQLSRKQLHTDTRRLRLFAGRALDV